MYQIKLSPYARIFYTEWLLAPTDSRYNVPLVQALSGDIDVDRLKVALKRYVDEHVLLNSHIKDLHGEPYWIKNGAINELEYSDTPVSRVEVLDYIALEFDLHHAPLYRFKLVRTDNNAYQFVLVFHHLVIDGATLDTGIIDSISNYYNDENYKAKYSFDEQIKLITNLSDTLFAKVEKNKAGYKEFWRNNLADVDGVDLRFLKLDRNDDVVQQDNSIKEIRFSYTADTLGKLKQIKKQYSVTPYIYGQSVFALLLHRYTGQEKIAISYPIAIREVTDFIYGAQVNTNIIPYSFSKKTTILELLKQAKEFFNLIKNDVQHGYYPIMDIIQECNRSLLNVGFIQTNLRDAPFKLHGVANVKVLSEFNTDSVPPDMLLFEQGLRDNQLNYRVRYNKSTMNGGLLNAFVASYKKIFSAILDELIDGYKGKTIYDYQILSDEQYNKIVYEFNKNRKEFPQDKTIHELFEEQVEKTPDNIAVVFKDIKLTYDELNRGANRLAHYLLMEYDIKPEELIAICLDRSEHVIIAMLAVLKAGGAYVPIDPTYPDERVGYVLKDARASLILTESKYKNKLTTQHGKLDVIDIVRLESNLHVEYTSNLSAPITSNNLMYVIYTSGSTGNPKGVLQQHNNVARLFVATQGWYHFTSEDIWTLFHSYVFDFTIWEIWGALLHGGRLIIPTTEQVKDTDLFYELCYQEKVTVLNQTPQAFYQFMNIAANRWYSNQRLSSLRYIIFGGERLNFKNLRNWFRFYGYSKPKLVNMYGITETTVHVTYKEIHEKDIGEVSNVGIAIPDQQLFILDNNLNPLPMGAIGELYVGGAGLARGYLNRSQLTAEKFIHNPFLTEKEKKQNINERLYKTGDLVRWLFDGALEYIGRNDSQVKIRGYRLELREIECKLINYPGIKQAVVLIKEFANRRYISDMHLIAYYVADKKLNESEIQKYLIRQLPEHMRPSILICLDVLPLTANGKLDKKALPQAKFFDSDKYVSARNEQEELICRAFADILDRDTVGINDDFFMFGGNSIKAIRLVTILQTSFDIRVADIFNLRTPALLAADVHFGKDVLRQKLEQLKLLYRDKPSAKRVLDTQLKEKIDGYLQRAERFSADGLLQSSISNVLLTGATGYLGCNILNQLLLLTQYKIFLLIRSNSEEEAFKRVDRKFQFYFDKTLSGIYSSRVFVVPCDIEQEKLGLPLQRYQTLIACVDSIIHAAALVKHYGEYNKFYSANVKATINLLELAKFTRQKISTLYLLIPY